MKLFSIIRYTSLFLLLGMRFLSFGQGPTQIQTIEKIVAKVDDQIILKTELDMAYLQYLNSGASKFNSEDLKCKVLETLIINKLLVAKSVIDSVVVDQETVDNQLDMRMKMLLQSYGGTEETIAKQYGKTVAELKSELRDQVKDQLIIQKMQGKITQNVEITPSQVRSFFASIPKDSLPFFSKEVQVAHLVYKPELDKEAKQQTIDLLLDIKKRIQNGEKSEDLARKYSEDPGSAVKGGELGFFKRKELVPEYEATALTLRPGEISDPVESKFGFHMIQLIEKRGNEYNSRHILIKPKSTGDKMEVSRKFLLDLKKQIESGKMDFETAAFKFSSDERTKSSGGYFTDQEGNNIIPAEQLDPTLYFVVDKMKEGQISEPLDYSTEDGSRALRLIYLIRKIPPHEANLKDDWQKIQAAALEEHKNAKVNKWFDTTKGEVFIDVDPEFSHCDILKD